jgi:hypothetical protein
MGVVAAPAAKGWKSATPHYFLYIDNYSNVIIFEQF